MKRLVFFLMLLLVSSGVLKAQELKRWTIGVSFSPSKTDEDGAKLLPSIAYNFNSWLSAGAELNLPLKDRGVYSSTGAEVFVAFHTPRLGGFSLTLAPVLGGSMIGAYSFSKEGGLRPVCSAIEPEPRRYRWYVGFRPTLSHAFSDRWAVSFAYGLYGYRSHTELWNIYRHKGEFEDSSTTGFTTSATYSSNIRLGVRYSF